MKIIIFLIFLNLFYCNTKIKNIKLKLKNQNEIRKFKLKNKKEMNNTLTINSLLIFFMIILPGYFIYINNSENEYNNSLEIHNDKLNKILNFKDTKKSFKDVEDDIVFFENPSFNNLNKKDNWLKNIEDLNNKITDLSLKKTKYDEQIMNLQHRLNKNLESKNSFENFKIN